MAPHSGAPGARQRARRGCHVVARRRGRKPSRAPPHHLGRTRGDAEPDVAKPPVATTHSLLLASLVRDACIATVDENESEVGPPNLARTGLSVADGTRAQTVKQGPFVWDRTPETRLRESTAFQPVILVHSKQTLLLPISRSCGFGRSMQCSRRYSCSPSGMLVAMGPSATRTVKVVLG